MPGYRSPDDRFAFLFNSYYVQAGPRHARDKRGHGLASRWVRRCRLPRAMWTRRSAACSTRVVTMRSEIAALVELGCHHEMQHQELLVTDLLHGFSYNPLLPAYRDPEPMPVTEEVPLPSPPTRAGSSRSATTARASPTTARGRATGSGSSRSRSPTGR